MTDLLPFEPWNAIERQILDVQNGSLAADALMHALAQADLFIPSAGDVAPDGTGYRPILLEQEDFSLVTLFTAAARMTKGMAPVLMRMNGRQFILRLPPRFGLVINPGYAAQVILPPEGVAALKSDLRGP